MVQLWIKLNIWVAIYILKDGLTLHCHFDSRECCLALVMGLFAMTMTWANWFTRGWDVFLIHTQIQEDSRERNSMNAAVISVTWCFCALYGGLDEDSHSQPVSVLQIQLFSFWKFPNVCTIQITHASLLPGIYYTQGMANQKQTRVSRKLSIKLVDFLLFWPKFGE